MMRIISGEFKGRRLKAPAGRTVRPTADRVKEAWFSILQQSIPGARVLDLFAGSGALGFEALSRGAVWVDFVERNQGSLAAIRANAEALNVRERVTLHRSDALRFAERLQPTAYDVAFADPPYAGAAAEELAELFRATPFARVLSIEHAAGRSLGGDDSRRYGDTAITFFYTPLPSPTVPSRPFPSSL
jgi:16S rRNA (guanine966-N2)-methyltransferase